jgi:hypothetical protein
MTYSLSITGIRDDSMFTAKNLTLSDANAQAGSQQNAMQLGASFLVKGPDGSQALYQLDAERSTPGNPVLRAVGP